MNIHRAKARRLVARSVSIVDVARHAGVSVGTVSNVLNRPERVNPAMRARVQSVIRELDFRPNPVAKSLRERRTLTIGLVLSDITTPFASVLARTVQAQAEVAGYSVVFADTDESIEREITAMNGFEQNGVDGIILAPTPGDHHYLAELVDVGLPIIAVNRRPDVPSVPTVLTDHYGGAVAATRHLIDHGHTRIGVVTRSPIISSIMDRHRGFEDALLDANIAYEPGLVIEQEPSMQGGRRAALQLMARDEGVTALMSFSTAMTLGCVIAFREVAIRVPEDLAFVGFDDATWSVAVSPPVTSVALKADVVGELATRQLLEWITTGNAPKEREFTVGTELTIRQSCGCSGEPSLDGSRGEASRE